MTYTVAAVLGAAAAVGVDLFVLRTRLLARGVFWATYPIMTMTEAPKVEVSLIDRPGTPSWGAGEPMACAIPAAIGNAVFDATGVRLRSVPFTPDMVKAALGTRT